MVRLVENEFIHRDIAMNGDHVWHGCLSAWELLDARCVQQLCPRIAELPMPTCTAA
jgi:hypothetical protein